jgi:putative Mn2+ efflux pump MntP
MSFLQTLLLVLGLNMDTFAISCAVALYHSRITPRLLYRVVFHFSLFQAGLLLIGWNIGYFTEHYFGRFDHWIAAGLLLIIGGRMIIESLKPQHVEENKPDPSRGLSLIVLSVANSLDAMAVGGSLGLLNTKISEMVVMAWIITVIVSAIGLSVGKKVSELFERRAEMVGGMVLCGIGVKILLSK